MEIPEPTGWSTNIKPRSFTEAGPAVASSAVATPGG